MVYKTGPFSGYVIAQCVTLAVVGSYETVYEWRRIRKVEFKLEGFSSSLYLVSFACDTNKIVVLRKQGEGLEKRNIFVHSEHDTIGDVNEG